MSWAWAAVTANQRLTEILELKADLAAERARADRLAEALRGWVHQTNGSVPGMDEVTETLLAEHDRMREDEG
jgi:hypothetical protein